MSADTGGPAPQLAVLIPCFNEESTIADVVADFRAALPAAAIYVFDNNSTDRSAAHAGSAGARVISEPRQGKGHVLRSMFRAVDADVYVLVDGDRTYSADAVHSLLRPVLAGEADMVIGSRLHPQATSAFTPLHRFGNRFYLFLLRVLFAIPLTDLLSGYRVLSRAVARRVHLTSDGFQVETELTIKTIRGGFRVVDRPVDLCARPAGSRSKIRVARDGVAILVELLALYAREAPRMFFTGAMVIVLAPVAAMLLVRSWSVRLIAGLLLAAGTVLVVRAMARRG